MIRRGHASRRTCNPLAAPNPQRAVPQNSSPHLHRMTFPGALVPGQAQATAQSVVLQSRRSIGINAPTGLGIMGISGCKQRLQPASLSMRTPLRSTWAIEHCRTGEKSFFFFQRCRRQGPGHAEETRYLEVFIHAVVSPDLGPRKRASFCDPDEAFRTQPIMTSRRHGMSP